MAKRAYAKPAKDQSNTLEGKSMKEWLSEPGLVVRRGELPDVIAIMVRYQKLERRSKHWYWRLAYWIRGRWLYLRRWLRQSFRPQPELVDDEE